MLSLKILPDPIEWRIRGSTACVPSGCMRQRRELSGRLVWMSLTSIAPPCSPELLPLQPLPVSDVICLKVVFVQVHLYQRPWHQLFLLYTVSVESAAGAILPSFASLPVPTRRYQRSSLRCRSTSSLRPTASAYDNEAIGVAGRSPLANSGL